MATNHGASFMLGDMGEKAAGKKVGRTLTTKGAEYAPTTEEVDALLADTAGDGKKLAAGLKRGFAALNELAQAGLTPDCLVTLALEKAPYPRGAKNPLNREQMIAALKGLFAIGEYLQP